LIAGFGLLLGFGSAWASRPVRAAYSLLACHSAR